MNNTTDLMSDRTSTLIRMPGNSFFAASFFITIPNVCAFFSMWKTKGIPGAVKLPIMNLLLSGILTGLCFLLQYVLMQSIPTTMYRSVCYFGLFTTLLCACGSFSIVTGIAIDRCVCLYFEYAYIKLLTTKRVIIFQGYMWLFAFCFAVSVFIDISSDFSVCVYRNVVGMIGQRLQIIYGIIFRIISACSYISIYIKMRGIVKSNGMKKRRIFRTTSKLLIICLVYHGMYMPIFCHQLYLLIFPDEFEKTQIISIIASSLTVVNIFINPIIYAWRFPECRLEMKKMVCFWNKGIMINVAEKRKKILVAFLDTPHTAGDN